MNIEIHQKFHPKTKRKGPQLEGLQSRQGAPSIQLSATKKCHGVVLSTGDGQHPGDATKKPGFKHEGWTKSPGKVCFMTCLTSGSTWWAQENWVLHWITAPKVLGVLGLSVLLKIEEIHHYFCRVLLCSIFFGLVSIIIYVHWCSPCMCLSDYNVGEAMSKTITQSPFL